VLLAHLAAQVFSVERIAPLLDKAREVVALCGVRNVSLLLGDGTFGWSAYAPYDAILVSAGSPGIPKPLTAQLAEGGRMVIPLGDRDEQMLAVLTRRGDAIERRDVLPVRFVPLLGTHGWTE